jgi:two-component system sensor histidine kinase BaeS
MSVRLKLFGAMMILVFFMGAAYFISTQGYLRNHLPTLVTAAERVETDKIVQLQQNIYNEMIHMALKIIAGLSLIALAIGYWLSRILTSPLRRLASAIDRVGRGDLRLILPVTTRDEYGKVTDSVNRMTASLIRSEEVRKHMVADIAHELRTPLTILQGHFELIQQSGEAMPPETILPLQDELIRLNQLVNDLHQLSLVEAGALPLVKQQIDMLTLLNRLIEHLSMEAEERGVRLKFDSSAQTTGAFVDPQRMTQVFYNLIGNAIRYTSAGGQVAIRLLEKPEMPQSDLIVTITDTGIGIPSEHVPHVFNRFYRVEDDRTRQRGGTGLGLAIAKQFVEAHGGQIEVESELNRGTQFTVSLPRNQSV